VTRFSVALFVIIAKSPKIRRQLILTNSKTPVDLANRNPPF
jgi:hypothetical protein